MEGAKAFDGWLVQRLQFEKRKEGNAVQYVHVTGGRTPTLSPLFDIVARFRSLIDRERSMRRKSGELPLAPFTFSRVASEKEAIPLLRAGHPFASAVEAMMRADDRGAAFAMWRVVRGCGFDAPRLFFRFDFVIEADLTFAGPLVFDRGGQIESVRRKADAEFGVLYRTVWFDADLGEVLEPSLLAELDKPYRPVRDGGKDINLRPDRWPAVEAAAPVGDWEGLCIRARRVAEERVKNAAEFVEMCQLRAERIRNDAAAANDIFKSRISRLSGAPQVAEQANARFEAEIAEAIAVGVEKPSIRVDVAGAVFLSEMPLPELTP
jgi:ATP-dependent helicase HepA